MVKLFFCLSSFLFFTSIGVLLLNRLFRNHIAINQRIAPFLPSQANQLESNEEDGSHKTFYIRIILPIMEKLQTFVLGKLPKNKIAQVEKKLQAAGHPFGLSAGTFILLQVILPVFLLLVFMALFLPLAEEKGKVLFLSAFVSLFAYFYLNHYLTAKSKQRTKEIEKAMPDFFDMLNVSIEAGMGLDGALKKVCSQMDSAIAKEFLSALEDMKLGKTRRQAFIQLRERVPSDFFRSVMNSIIQADQMGIGLSKVLQAQTQRIREKQRFSAKERAMKAPVKMLIPMVLFIFPTLFVVLLGPVIINLITKFSQ